MYHQPRITSRAPLRWSALHHHGRGGRRGQAIKCLMLASLTSLLTVISSYGCQGPRRVHEEMRPDVSLDGARDLADSSLDQSPQDLAHPEATQDLGVIIDARVVGLDRDVGSTLHPPRPAPSPTSELIAPGGWRWARGLIHMHSVHSHDACDGDPKPNGLPNAPCLAELRRAVCDSQLDFMLLTDHPESFADVTFTEATLHQADAGDQLIYDEADRVIGNRLKCADLRDVLIAPGAEGDLMPVMLRSAPRERGWYRERSPASVEALRAAGAIVLHAHTEERTFEELWPLGLDGFEIYNLHANVNPRGDQLREFLPDLSALLLAGAEAPHPDLALLAIIRENPRALSMWDHFIAHRETLGFAGSDIHQNLPPLFESPDGERLDSYRRLSRWFANYMLVDALGLDSLRSAINAGRLYVVFHLLGEPIGLDFALFDETGTRYELGSRVDLRAGLTLELTPPLPPEGSMIQARVLRISVDPAHPEPGESPSRELIAESQGEVIRLNIRDPGAYRVEIYLTPEHLRGELRGLADQLIRPTPWIYSNPIYVRSP